MIRSHDEAFDREGALGFEGVAVRITLPCEERIEALKELDLMNINSYSLLGTDESLIRTVARRENLFRNP